MPRSQMASSLLFSAALLLICCSVVSMATIDSPTASYLDDTMRCVRTCGFRKRLHRLPCYVNECGLEYLRGTALWQLLVAMDKQDNQRSEFELRSHFPDVRKRVKEVWEGPAPADINH